ncbi:MAG TPA: hypothetical protein VNO33_19200, partial [Kofleriaceae bacterium]|nr:hypothetical protein [Kofleriaceae bacterium]
MPNHLVAGTVLLSMLCACSSAKKPDAAAPESEPPAARDDSSHAAAVAEVARLKAKADENPLLVKWSGPYGGVPPWDKVKTEMFPAAFEIGLAMLLAEVEAIATDPAPPTFKNTIGAMENAGRHQDRAEVLFGVWTDNLNTPEVQAVDREWAPKVAATSDKITFNEKLFARLSAVHAARESAGLTAEQKRLLERTYDDFVRAGAKLNAEQKQQLG